MKEKKGGNMEKTEKTEKTEKKEIKKGLATLQEVAKKIRREATGVIDYILMHKISPSIIYQQVKDPNGRVHHDFYLDPAQLELFKKQKEELFKTELPDPEGWKVAQTYTDIAMAEQTISVDLDVIDETTNKVIGTKKLMLVKINKNLDNLRAKFRETNPSPYKLKEIKK